MNDAINSFIEELNNNLEAWDNDRFHYLKLYPDLFANLTFFAATKEVTADSEIVVVCRDLAEAQIEGYEYVKLKVGDFPEFIGELSVARLGARPASIETAEWVAEQARIREELKGETADKEDKKPLVSKKAPTVALIALAVIFVVGFLVCWGVANARKDIAAPPVPVVTSQHPLKVFEEMRLKDLHKVTVTTTVKTVRTFNGEYRKIEQVTILTPGYGPQGVTRAPEGMTESEVWETVKFIMKNGSIGLPKKQVK